MSAQSARFISRPGRDERIPRALLIAIGALVLTVLAGVTAARLAGIEPSARPPALEQASARTLVTLRELPGGGVTVLDPATGAVMAEFANGQDGFLRGILRVLGRTRMQHRVAAEGPVELLRWPSGHLALIDPATGWRIELIGFGQTNLATFAGLMSDTPDKWEDIR